MRSSILPFAILAKYVRETVKKQNDYVRVVGRGPRGVEVHIRMRDVIRNPDGDLEQAATATFNELNEKCITFRTGLKRMKVSMISVIKQWSLEISKKREDDYVNGYLECNEWKPALEEGCHASLHLLATSMFKSEQKSTKKAEAGLYLLSKYLQLRGVSVKPEWLQLIYSNEEMIDARAYKNLYARLHNVMIDVSMPNLLESAQRVFGETPEQIMRRQEVEAAFEEDVLPRGPTRSLWSILHPSSPYFSSPVNVPRVVSL